MKRPPLAEYEALRDWLEAEIDRKAAARVNPGSVVLHRLNRTEYANAVRDLLDLEIDVTTLLPPDDSARGFDNIAGSLTISPTLLEAYTTAAARVARMAVGYWKSPTESTYLAPGDTSQNQHIEGLPFGTRGGMLVRHNFPADGEYKFSIQNFGIGSFIPGEQLELIIDGERAHLFKYQGVGTEPGHVRGGRWIPGRDHPGESGLADGGRHVPGDELPAQPRHRQAIRPEVARKQQHPSAAVLPGDRFPADSRPVHCPASGRLPQHPQGLYLPARRKRRAQEEEPAPKQILSTLARRAYRRPATAQDREALMTFYEEGRRAGTFEDGIELALRRLLASPQFLVRAEKEPANLAAGPSLSHQRPGTGLSFVVLPVEQHSGRRADQPWPAREG